jgi:hypothetical protein
LPVPFLMLTSMDILFSLLILLFTFQSLDASSLAEQFKKTGYVEICDETHTEATFDTLYAHFDKLIDFLQTYPIWRQKLYSAKERFIRSKQRNSYCTDFFGFYDESEREDRRQINFYYSPHFHEFICSHYPEFNQALEIIRFFEFCYTIQNSYEKLFNDAAVDLGLKPILSSNSEQPAILFKVIKYFPSYTAIRPHYDGTLFSLFLHSTDNQSLLLSPYKSSFTLDDFSFPKRVFTKEHNQNSILLIPGALLTEFSIYPTPHIVISSGKVRYATIAFALKACDSPKKVMLSPLPSFRD